MSIKSVLKEELENSLKLEKRYSRELEKLPKGSLIRKNIKGHNYYYLVVREDGRVKFSYQGKDVPQKVIQQYAKNKEQRAKYRKLRSQVKKQIKFLRSSLRGKQEV